MFNALFMYFTFSLKKKNHLFPYKSFGLVGSYIVEKHVKSTGEKSTLPWRPCHCESLSTASYPIGKEQTCHNQTEKWMASSELKIMTLMKIHVNYWKSTSAFLPFFPWMRSSTRTLATCSNSSVCDVETPKTFWKEYCVWEENKWVNLGKSG